MKVQNVKVTTTSGFEGVEIEEYIEPITAHVVVGMNFFKDFLSGFSDFFGGKSKTYQNTLASINDEAINELRRKAYALGGNCVLALKIDNDEVSAQGKSMMMVTAIGTAAKAKFVVKPIKPKEEYKADQISNEMLSYYKQKRRYVIESEKNELQINDELWEFVKVNKVNELAQYLLSGYLNFVDTYQEFNKDELNKFSDNLNEYLSVIDAEVAINCLYKRLQKEQKTELRKAIVSKIRRLQLIDFSLIINMIEGTDFNNQKSALQLLQAEKVSYESSDIMSIDQLINLISTKYIERGKVSTKKKVLSSKHKQIWICECTEENDRDKAYCTSCQKDICGFFEHETKPAEIIEKLFFDLEILKMKLN
jgi:uncharacterized protein YbjQ (UPF0145 family)